LRPLAFLPLNEKQLDLLHRYLYLLGLMTIACGLAWSNALMSIGQFILAGNWILEGKFLSKWIDFRENRTQQLLLSFWLAVLIGFLWSSNLDYAMKDARIKFPLFLLPFVIGSSAKLKINEWKVVLLVYLGTLFLLCSTSLGKYFGLIGDAEIVDKRELSIYISHIRYGLNLLLGSILAIYYSKIFGNKLRWILLSISVYLFISLLLLQLYTALGIGLLIFSFYILYRIWNSKIKYIKWIGLGGTLTVLLISLFFIKNIRNDFYKQASLDYDQNILIEQTELGNPYVHNVKDQRQENGVYLWRFVQEDELRNSWNKRSSLDFDGKDKKGNLIYHTLVRFLSSQGSKKDANGVNSLSEEEIKAIEEGIPNPYYLNHLPIQNRIYTTFFELDHYQKFGYAEGFSLGMRLEYWKTAWRIIEKNMYLGVGTGDVQDSFNLQYHLDESSLSQKNRRRAHNQFLTIWLTYGLLGFLFFVIYLFYPLRNRLTEFYPIFFLIVVLSFLTEDTLETQAGVTFFAYFNSLYLLGMDTKG